MLSKSHPYLKSLRDDDVAIGCSHPFQRVPWSGYADLGSCIPVQGLQSYTVLCIQGTLHHNARTDRMMMMMMMMVRKRAEI